MSLPKENSLPPLENPYFLLYVKRIKPEYNNQPRLHTDEQFLQRAHSDYFDFFHGGLIEHFKPDFPPDIKVEEFVPRFDKRKPITENRGNAFIVYRKHLVKYLQTSRIKLDQKEISPLAGYFWRNETPEVKDHYKKISDQIKRRYR